jgi:outer membrane protein assembly factor BamB
MAAVALLGGTQGCGDPSAVEPPTLSITSPRSQDTILAGDTVLLRVEVVGPGSPDPSSLEWATAWGRPLGRGDSVFTVLTDTGTYAIVALARDGATVLATDRVTVTVIPNGAPVVAVEGLQDPCFVYITDTVRLVARAADPESSAVRIEWWADGAGLIGEGDSLRWVPGPGAEGTRVIAARALDPQGNRDDALEIVRVLGGPLFKWARTYPAPGTATDCGGTIGYSLPLALADDGTIRAGLRVAGYGSGASNYAALLSLSTQGDVQWSFGTDQAPIEHWAGLVVAPDGRTYFANYDGVLHALSPDGTVLWSAEVLGNDWHGHPALAADGALYVAGKDVIKTTTHTLTRIAPETGNVLWKLDRAIGCGGSNLGVRADGHLSMTCATWALDVLPDGTIARIDSLLTRFSYLHFQQSAHDREGVGYYPGGGGLRAFRSDHTDAWQIWIGNAEPVIGSDRAIYVPAGGGVHRLTPEGAVVWEAPLPASSPSSFTRMALLADGTLWVGNGRFLTRLRAATGERMAEVELTAAVSSGLVVASDGTLYVIAGANRIVAIAGGAPLDPDAPWPVWRRDNRRTSSVNRP